MLVKAFEVVLALHQAARSSWTKSLPKMPSLPGASGSALPNTVVSYGSSAFSDPFYLCMEVLCPFQRPIWVAVAGAQHSEAIVADVGNCTALWETRKILETGHTWSSFGVLVMRPTVTITTSGAAASTSLAQTTTSTTATSTTHGEANAAVD
eukprot:740448-Amphidinium_carterae.1